MCRILSHLCVKPQTASDYLLHSPCSLLAQSKADAKNLQKDGWGVAAQKNGRFVISKSPNALYDERAKLAQVAARSRSRFIVAHIRAASNPLDLPLHELIAPAHTQPFGVPNFVFAHNGTINIVKETRDKLLGAYAKRLKGKNDSEIYFWLLQRWRHRCNGDVPAAFAAVAKDLWTLWHKLPRETQKRHQRPYSSLNTVVSDGRGLYALCHSLLPAKKKSLCLGDQPFNSLAYRLSPDKDRLVVASEKMSREDGWKVMPMHSVLAAHIAGATIGFEIRRFKWNR
ncbi:MAG: class II glutamine amidotransferase [Elusimicrobiota bacterium]